MNIAVINIKDLIKFALLIGIVIIVIISGITIVKGKEELKEEMASEKSEEKEDSSFLYCLGLEMPLMESEPEENEKKNKEQNKPSKILDTQLAMLYNIGNKKEENTEERKEQEGIAEEKPKEEVEDKRIASTEGQSTKVIEENNITPSYTDTGGDIQLKNQSKYDVKELLQNSNYEIKNKNKVIIYHTHTCESYTSSEKYPYQMTGAYRTTDLNYTVSRVRRRIRDSIKTIAEKQ